MESNLDLTNLDIKLVGSTLVNHNKILAKE